MRLTITYLLVFLVAGVSSVFARKRNITEKDLWEFVWIGDPQVSRMDRGSPLCT